MNVQPALHPTDQILSSYGLGKLDDASAEAVNKHLEECSDCRKRVAEMSADSFLGRVRDAQAAGKSILGQSQAGGTESLKHANAAPPPSANTLPPGLAEHTNYQVLRELGRGGMGVVYLAENRMMGRKEVLKVVSSHLLNRTGVLDRFLREIRLAAQLDHPNIVTACSASRVGESLVLSMEYVAGYDLSQLVKRNGPLSVAQACNFVYQAALGLQHAHQHGMVHRDIKPSNLMLAREGNKPVIKVLDFGLAKVTREGLVEGSLTHEGQMLGTPDFIAPEQIRDAQSAGIQADIYSLGCTLYYLLTGSPPFEGPSLYDILQAHHSMDAKPLNLIRPAVPFELAAVVAKMMAKEPERRFQTPAEVAEALKPFFKPGAHPGAGLRPEISRVGKTEVSSRPVVAGVAPARPATLHAAPARAPRSLSTPKPEGAAWESLIELRETEFSAAAAKPEPHVARARAPVRRPPWVWASVAAGVFFVGLVVASVVILWPRNGTIVSANLPEQSVVSADGKEFSAGGAGGSPTSVGSGLEQAPASPPAAPREHVDTAEASGARYGLRFDPGRNSFVRTKLKYDGGHPVTLEAYVRPLARPDYAGSIISCVEGSGIEITILAEGNACLDVHSRGQYHRVLSRGSLIGKRAHVAGVLADGHLLLFVNGKREGSLNLPGPFDPSPLPFYVGGNPNRDGSAACLFNGIIEEVRISNSARYGGDFDPEELLGADTNTLLLYRFKWGTDNIAVDASGHGNDGMILGAESILSTDAPLSASTAAGGAGGSPTRP